MVRRCKTVKVHSSFLTEGSCLLQCLLHATLRSFVSWESTDPSALGSLRGLSAPQFQGVAKRSRSSGVKHSALIFTWCTAGPPIATNMSVWCGSLGRVVRRDPRLFSPTPAPAGRGGGGGRTRRWTWTGGARTEPRRPRRVGLGPRLWPPGPAAATRGLLGPPVCAGGGAARASGWGVAPAWDREGRPFAKVTDLENKLSLPPPMPRTTPTPLVFLSLKPGVHNSTLSRPRWGPGRKSRLLISTRAGSSLRCCSRGPESSIHCDPFRVVETPGVAELTFETRAPIAVQERSGL